MTDVVSFRRGRLVDVLGRGRRVAVAFEATVVDRALELRSTAVGMRIGSLRLRLPRAVAPRAIGRALRRCRRAPARACHDRHAADRPALRVLERVHVLRGAVNGCSEIRRIAGAAPAEVGSSQRRVPRAARARLDQAGRIRPMRRDRSSLSVHVILAVAVCTGNSGKRFQVFRYFVKINLQSPDKRPRRSLTWRPLGRRLGHDVCRAPVRGAAFQATRVRSTRGCRSRPDSVRMDRHSCDIPVRMPIAEPTTRSTSATGPILSNTEHSLHDNRNDQGTQAGRDQRHRIC
ncbi:DUF4166 domain-containing protein [Streptomyces sp. ISL-90]|nr:DUF4166 domain-containing protein [Streptomyces sp. ISL-90]